MAHTDAEVETSRGESGGWTMVMGAQSFRPDFAVCAKFWSHILHFNLSVCNKILTRVGCHWKDTGVDFDGEVTRLRIDRKVTENKLTGKVTGVTFDRTLIDQF